MSARLGACMFRHLMVLLTQEHFRRQVLALLPAERAGHHDGLEGELLHARGNIAATPLASDYELLPSLHHETHDITNIGEYLAKVYVEVF